MNNKITYTGNIQWWIILFFWGFYVWMIFGYIHQWGNNPINMAGLIFFGILWILVSALVLASRFFLTIDDKFVILKSLILGTVTIDISQIKDVSVKKMNIFKIYAKMYAKMYAKGFECHDFTGKVLKIQTKNGKEYQFAIKDAQNIKEEIEKRMLNFNDKTS